MESSLDWGLTGRNAEISLAVQERALVPNKPTRSELFKQASGFNILGGLFLSGGDVHIHHHNVAASPESSPILDTRTTADFAYPAPPHPAYGQTTTWNPHSEGYSTTYEPEASSSDSQSFSRPRNPENRDHPNLFTTTALVAHWVATDDEHFKEVMLGAYPDFLRMNPEEQLFDIIQKQFEQAVAKPYSERYRIVRMIITWLPTIPPESNVLRLVEAFVATNPHIVLGDRTVIRRTLGHCSANSPPRRPEPPVEPVDFYDVAAALTILAANIFNKLRLCDYSAYERGEPSRFDDLIAMNEKLSLWVKDCILSQRDRDGRKLCVKRFNKVAQECRKLRNYNSMATIARVLDEKSKPLAYIPRTMDILSKSTRESLKQLLAITDPYDNYREYRKQRGGDKSGCIPWLTVLLSDLKRDLLRYPSIVDHQPELINFERYRKLAQRIHMYRMPADLERRRRGAHVTFLEAKFSNIDFPDADEEAEVLRLWKLKEKEEKEYKDHTLELRKLGFRA